MVQKSFLDFCFERFASVESFDSVGRFGFLSGSFDGVCRVGMLHEGFVPMNTIEVLYG